ncbi:MAG: GtrA family protein [Alphaproteobacteria bacterium]|nr:GtrA family protein [Alphaproteobacteria bacterium]
MLKSGGLIDKVFQLLKKPTFIQFLKFGVVGGLGFLVDATFTYLGIYAFAMDRIPAGFFAFPFAVTFTWIGNRLYTFRHIDHDPMAKQLSKFAAVCGIGIVFNRGTYSLLVSTIPFIYDYPILGLMAGSIAAMFFNFFASRKLVFK